jgi:hypothetical protein
MSLSPPQNQTPTKSEILPASSIKATKRVIAKIRDTAYLDFIEWVEAEDGHLSLVHIAAFAHPEHGACEAYVKLEPESTNKHIANEITSYLCAHALGIPQPEIAFVANIPLNRLRKPPQWIKALAKTQAIMPAFCTKRLDGESAAIRVPATDIPLLANEIAKWEFLEKAVALDDNIAQTDRHLNNLIRLSRNKYAIIDGGRLANQDSTSCWNPSTLDALSLYRNRLSEHIWSHKPSQRSVDQMLDNSQHHAVKLISVAEELKYWWRNLLEPAECQAFANFLHHRSYHLEVLIRKRYGMLI